MVFDIGNTAATEIQQKRNSNTVMNASSCEKLELLSRTAALANQQQESIVDSRNVPFSTVVLRSPISTDADEAVTMTAASAMATAASITTTATNTNTNNVASTTANHLVRATSHTNLNLMSTSSHLVETIRSPVPTLLGSSSAQSSPLGYSPLPPYGVHHNPHQNPFTIPRRNSQDHLHQQQHPQHPQYQLPQAYTLPVPSSSSLSYSGHTNPFVLRQRDQQLHHQDHHHHQQQQQQHLQDQHGSHGSIIRTLSSNSIPIVSSHSVPAPVEAPPSAAQPQQQQLRQQHHQVQQQQQPPLVVTAAAPSAAAASVTVAAATKELQLLLPPQHQPPQHPQQQQHQPPQHLPPQQQQQQQQQPSSLSYNNDVYQQQHQQHNQQSHYHQTQQIHAMQEQLQEKDRVVASLQHKVHYLENQINELRQLPTGKISHIPADDMIRIMEEYGSETSNQTIFKPQQQQSHRNNKNNKNINNTGIKKASIVRQFRRWNPEFFRFFLHQQGQWIPKLGKEGELRRRVEKRRQLLLAKQQKK